jgi:hypothetical protein
VRRRGAEGVRGGLEGRFGRVGGVEARDSGCGIAK